LFVQGNEAIEHSLGIGAAIDVIPEGYDQILCRRLNEIQ
jgi:hypothetical protein